MMQKYITEDKLKQLQRIKNEIESARHETSFLEFDHLSSAPEALKKAIEKVRAWLDGANVEMYKHNHREMWAQALSIVLRLIQADVATTMVARFENRVAEIWSKHIVAQRSLTTQCLPQINCISVFAPQARAAALPEATSATPMSPIHVE